MKPNITRIVAAALLAMVCLAGGKASQAKVVGDTIYLGAVLSFSGKYRVGGTNTYNGYEFAIERINANGGISVWGKTYELKIQYVDDRSDPVEARRQAERLIVEDGIKFMLGPYSSEMTKAVASMTEYYKIPMVEAEGAARDLFNRDYRYIFGLLSTCEHYMEMVIDLAVRKERATGRRPSDLTLAIAVQNERFSLCVRAAVVYRAKKDGIEIVLDERLPNRITDMKNVLTEVASKAPDIFIVSGHSIGAEITVRHKGEVGLHVPYIGITHCEAGEIVTKSPQAAEGIYCPAQWGPELPYKDDLFGTALDFSNEMKAKHPNRYSVEVPYQAASAAAAVLVWKDAFERANDPDFEPEELRDALANTDLKTFYGRLKFEPTGQIDSEFKPMILRQIRGGQFVIVNPP